MRAATIEGAGRVLAETGQERRPASTRLARSIFARARRILAIVLIGLAVTASIIALRILLWAIGHPDHPFFREFSKFWS
jgi:hypothetical protein